MLDHIGLSIVLLACLLFSVVPAQAKIEILSTVIYTNHGDRIPLITDEYHRLTPLGAQQLYDAGASMRARYIAPEPNTTDLQSQTWGLPPILLDGEFLTVLTTREPYNVASAQAFMQGLYPPLVSNGTLQYIDASFRDSNNNIQQGPLNGMQFAPISTVSDQYASAMYLKGATNCPMFTQRLLQYVNSSQYNALNEGSRALYERLSSQFLNHVTDPDIVLGYANAWAIYDYLNYQYTHNSTMAKLLDPADLAEARVLASDWAFALYANTSETGRVGQDPLDAIAGRTLANLVLNLFADSILSEGTKNKVNLLFGDQIAMISFAALARLMVPQHAQFFNLPASGSSYIFELYASMPDNSTEYPSSSNMFVRFLYANGTNGVEPVEYPLFGQGNSQAVMQLSDFTASMNSIMISNRTQWCNTCHSTATFCIADEAIRSSKTTSNHGVSPAVAGVIGALVAIVFALLVLGFAMLLGGVRLYRVQTKRRSELGGFKGGEKLASDQDLTLPKSGAGAVVIETNDHTTRGHERVGSWELREQAKRKEMDIEATGHNIGATHIRRSSLEDDEIHVNPFGDPVHPRDSL